MTVEMTDEHMRERLAQAKQYSLVLLWQGEQYGADGSDKVVWEHGRRNLVLNEAGTLPIVCPVADDSPLCGIGIFTGSVDETRSVLDGDPGVQAGLFNYEIHPVRGFPGSRLP